MSMIVCPVYLNQLEGFIKKGGFRVSVLGKDVNVKIWIHFFIGDTEGNNKWLGHYSGNKSQVRRPYRDCCCDFKRSPVKYLG